MAIYARYISKIIVMLSFVLAFESVGLAGDLALAPQVMHEINQVLKASDGLHKSLLSQDEEQVDMSLRDVLVQLNRTKSVLTFVKPHERRHLIRILDAAHDNFELTQSTYGDERKQRLEVAYNQLVNLVRIYRVDRAYAIFFCPKDRTTWVQRGSKAQNPFHAYNHRESCGIRVTR